MSNNSEPEYSDNDQQPIDPQLAKLKWACRRGMLELDVILLPFLESEFNSMTAQQRDHYQQFLESDDPDLYSWLMGYAQPPQQYANQVRSVRRWIDSRL